MHTQHPMLQGLNPAPIPSTSTALLLKLIYLIKTRNVNNEAIQPA